MPFMATISIGMVFVGARQKKILQLGLKPIASPLRLPDYWTTRLNNAIMQPIMQALSRYTALLDNDANNTRPHRAGGCARPVC